MNRWMRNNQKVVLYFICVFILPTFAISGAIYAFFEVRGSTIGSFEVEPGDVITVSATRFQGVQRRIAYWYNASDPDIVWMHMVLSREAENAGVTVSDAEVAEFAPAFWGASSLEEYRTALARRRLSPSDWETTVREVLTIARYQSLMMRDARVLEADVFERFQQQNERRKFDFVQYSTDAFLADFNPIDFQKDEVLAFWNQPENSAVRAEKRIPAKYDLTVAYASFDGTDLAGLGDLSDGLEITDAEIQAAYDDPLNFDRFAVAASSEDEEEGGEEHSDGEHADGDEESGSEEGEGEEADEDSTDSDSDGDSDDAEEEAEKVLPSLDDLKERIERELRLKKALDRARTQAIEVHDKAKADERAASEWKEGESEGEKPVPVPLALGSFATGLGLSFADAKQTTAEELEEFAAGSGVALSVNPFGVGLDDLSDVRTSKDGSAYFFHYKKQTPSREAPFDEEIEAEARELMIEDRAYQKAKENAETFVASLRKATEKALEASIPDFVKEEKEELKRQEEEKKKAIEEAKKKAEAEALKDPEEGDVDAVEDELFEGEDSEETSAETEGQEGSETEASNDASEDSPTEPDPAADGEGDEPSADTDVGEENDEQAGQADDAEEEGEEEEDLPTLDPITPTDEEIARVTSLATWNQLVDTYAGKAFEQMVKLQGLTTESLGPIKRLSPVDEEVENESSEALKFLMSNGVIHRMAEGAVQAVTNHPQKEYAFVVTVRNIELPDYSEVTAEDRETLLSSMRSQNQNQMAFAMGIYAQRFPSMAGQVLQRARLNTEVRTPTPEPGAPR